jgi:hypothetical protein
MIESSIAFGYEHRGRFGDDPIAGSRAHAEFTTDTGSFSAHRRHDIEEAHEWAAGIYLLSSSYLLTGLARLLYNEMQLFAYQVVARSVVECVAKAWWLDDTEASMDERLARFYIDRLHNIEEMVSAERLPKADLATKREQLIKRAARSGIDPKFDKNKKLIGFGETVKVGSTGLAGRFFKALGFEDGDLWYRRVSAVVHATPYGLLDFYKMTDIPGSELKELLPSLSIEEVRLAVIVSTQAYLGAVEFDSWHFGWESERVAKYRQQLLVQMTSLTFEE